MVVGECRYGIADPNYQLFNDEMVVGGVLVITDIVGTGCAR
jgi:hypothetical protein